MKKKTKIIVFAAVLIVAAAIIFAVFAGRAQNTDPTAYTVGSLRTLTENFYEMDYTADYRLDEMLRRQPELIRILFSDYDDEAQRDADVMAFNCDVLGLDELKEAVGSAGAADTDQFGCTAFATENDKGDNMLARNMDWTNGDAGVVVHTAPDDGYASVGIADLGLLGISSDDIANYRELSLLAPYATVDGVNSEGLACCLLIIDEDGTIQGNAQSPSENSLYSGLVVRTILDKCGTVSEAVELLRNSELYSSGATAAIQEVYGPSIGEDIHWLVTDKSGEKVVIECIRNELVVNTADSVLDLGDAEFNAEGYCGFYYKWMYNGFDEGPNGEIYWPVRNGVVDDPAELSRSAEDYLIATNFYISEDPETGADAAAEFIGEGVTRYKQVHDFLESTPAGERTDEKLLNILRDCKYSDDEDYLAISRFLADEMSLDIAANLEADKQEGSGKAANRYSNQYFWLATVDSGIDYETMLALPFERWDEVFDADRYDGFMAAYRSANDTFVRDPYNAEVLAAAGGWETLWSALYNTNCQTLTVFPHENYDKAFSFGISYAD